MLFSTVPLLFKKDIDFAHVLESGCFCVSRDDLTVNAIESSYFLYLELEKTNKCSFHTPRMLRKTSDLQNHFCSSLLRESSNTGINRYAIAVKTSM